MTPFGKIIFGTLGIIIVVGVFYGVGSYVSYDNVPVPTQTEVIATTTDVVNLATTTDATSTKPSGKKIPFTQFLSLGGSHSCTVTMAMGTTTSEGIAYIHGALVRADFSTTSIGQGVDSKAVIRDGYIYSWSSVTTSTGIKVKIVISEEQEVATPQTVQLWNPNQVGDYTCKDWIADDTKFTLPKTIAFIEAK